MEQSRAAASQRLSEYRCKWSSSRRPPRRRPCRASSADWDSRSSLKVLAPSLEGSCRLMEAIVLKYAADCVVAFEAGSSGSLMIRRGCDHDRRTMCPKSEITP